MLEFSFKLKKSLLSLYSSKLMVVNKIPKEYLHAFLTKFLFFYVVLSNLKNNSFLYIVNVLYDLKAHIFKLLNTII